MLTSFISGFCLMGLLCIFCLMASVCALFKVQELHNRCIDILVCACDWLEQIRREPEVTAHEGTE